MKWKRLGVIGLLASLILLSAWMWKRSLDKHSTAHSAAVNPSAVNPSATFQKSVSQEQSSLSAESSDEMLTTAPLPDISPKLAKQENTATTALKTLALPHEHTFSEETSPPVLSPGFKKQASHLTEEEQVVLNYVQALEYINKGINNQAESLLLDNLALLPSHLVSRMELANLYLRINQELNAEQVVSEGLTQQQHPELLKLMAMILERRGELKLALEYLDKIPPHYKNDRNTIILLGHVYQQTGHFTLAKKQYDRLLEAEPTNSLWLLGAAMALEGQGKKREALKSYLQLQSDPTLESSLSQYIAERIASLKG